MLCLDTYAKHQRAFHILQAFLRSWIRQKFNFTYEDFDIDGPFLLIPNHSCAWDPLLVAMSLRHKHVYFVASEHLFRLGLISRAIETIAAPIPRRKASSGADTVKACLRHLRAGHSVCLFAEGEQSWSGQSIPVFSATGKLAKSSGATLVTFRLEGAYLSLPRWGSGIRRGRVRGYPVAVYPPEILKSMSPGEINVCINRDIAEDAWARQRLSPVAFRGKNRAEGMERALYLCPGCRRVGTLRTQNDHIFCDCGLDLEFTETGFFSPETPFETLSDWDDWQRRTLCSRDFYHGDADMPLFSDGGVMLSKVTSGHQERTLDCGGLLQYEDRLVCAGWCFPLRDIDSMAMVLTNRLLLSVNGDYYELRAGNRVNLRKYLEIWEELQ